jgi:hypothetical protein
MFRKPCALFVATVILSCALPASADSLSINFDNYSTGNLPGSSGADTRTPGGPNWWYPSNAATSAQVVNIGGSNNAIYVYNNGNHNDGVVANILSPKLNVLAGEGGPDAQPGAQADVFTSSFMFKTAPTSATAGFQFKSETWGQDRTTWLDFFADSTNSNKLMINYSGVQSTGNTPNSDVFTNNHGAFHNGYTSLNWGDWYRVDTTVNFVDGPSNDVVTVNVFDAMGTLVWNATDTTWEQYYRLDSEQLPNGNIVTGADAIAFQMRNSTPDAPGGNLNGVYIDNVTIAAVPLPASAWMGLALLAGVGIFKLRTMRRAA